MILEPAAVLDAVGFMFWDFGGSALLDQRSFLNDRIGTQIFGDNITVWDDVYHPLQTGAPFDGEGMRRHRLKLIDKGVVQQVTYARSSAHRMLQSEMASQVGPVKPTGHGFALPNEIGEAPLNMVFESPAAGQSQTVEEMIADTDRGILVTRLWYIREVDPYEKILTGMTRDGTFLVEDGKLRRRHSEFSLQRKPAPHAAECGSHGRPGPRQRRGIHGHGGAGNEGPRLQLHRNYEILIVRRLNFISQYTM